MRPQRAIIVRAARILAPASDQWPVCAQSSPVTEDKLACSFLSLFALLASSDEQHHTSSRPVSLIQVHRSSGQPPFCGDDWVGAGRPQADLFHRPHESRRANTMRALVANRKRLIGAQCWRHCHWTRACPSLSPRGRLLAPARSICPRPVQRPPLFVPPRTSHWYLDSGPKITHNHHRRHHHHPRYCLM